MTASKPDVGHTAKFYFYSESMMTACNYTKVPHIFN